MSRAGTPADNPIIESLNGWMKAELILDFGISKVSNLKKTLDQYVLYHLASISKDGNKQCKLGCARLYS